MNIILIAVCLCQTVLAGLPPHGHYQAMPPHNLLPPVYDDGQYREESYDHQSYDDGQYKEETYDDGQSYGAATHSVVAPVYSAPVPSYDDDGQYNAAAYESQSDDDGQYMEQAHDDGQYQAQSYDDGQYDQSYDSPMYRQPAAVYVPPVPTHATPAPVYSAAVPSYDGDDGQYHESHDTLSGDDGQYHPQSYDDGQY